MFLQLIDTYIRLTTEIRALEIILTYIMLFMLQIVISYGLCRLEHSFKIKDVFPLLDYNILIDLLKLFGQPLPL